MTASQITQTFGHFRSQVNETRLQFFLESQLNCGPRVPSKPGHTACKEFITSQLRAASLELQLQDFNVVTQGNVSQCTNIIARYRPTIDQRIALCAHWDTRPFSDEDPIFENQRLVCPGANDGASGVALLLELAHQLNALQSTVGIDLVFFDAEDQAARYDSSNYCLGSKYYAQELAQSSSTKPMRALVFDMVADPEALFTIEAQSWQAAPELVQSFWSLGLSLLPKRFSLQMTAPILDDHLSFLRQNIPSILLIDSELLNHASANPRRHYWHTQKDTIHNCSPSSLADICTLVLVFLALDQKQS